MPLEELLALYGYRGEDQENECSEEENEEEDVVPEEGSPASEMMDDKDSEHSLPDPPSKLSALYEPIPENDDSEASRLTRCKNCFLLVIFVWKVSKLIYVTLLPKSRVIVKIKLVTIGKTW